MTATWLLKMPTTIFLQGSHKHLDIPGEVILVQDIRYGLAERNT